MHTLAEAPCSPWLCVYHDTTISNKSPPSLFFGTIHSILSFVSNICLACFCDALLDEGLSSNWEDLIYPLAKSNGIVCDSCNCAASRIECPLPWLFRLDLAVDNSFHCWIIHLDCCGRLFVTHSFEYGPNVYCLSRHDVNYSEFGFSCWWHDIFDDLGNVENGVVVWWVEVVEW